MTTLGLLAFGVALGLLGPRLLDRWSWPTRSPVLGIVAWQVLTLSVFVSLVGAGVTLAAHAAPEAGLLARLMHACSVLLPEDGLAQAGPLVPVVGALVAVGFVGGLLVAAHRGWRRRRAELRRQHDLLSVVCVHHDEPDVMVLQHAVPTVFCVPGRGPAPRVVVSRGALEALTASQLHQVLAHERAHLSCRHHLVLAWADAFAAVLGGRLGSARARARVAELVEMHADDAAGGANRRELAEAVVALAGGARPVGAMGAAGSALSRVTRLTAPVVPVPARTRAGILAGLALIVVLPGMIASAPGLASFFVEACPFWL